MVTFYWADGQWLHSKLNECPACGGGLPHTRGGLHWALAGSTGPIFAHTRGARF